MGRKPMTFPTRSLVALAMIFALAGCMSAASHRSAVTDASGDRLTVGAVQRDIDVGMSGAEVAEILGSPNIVTTDEQRREVWIYDKIATDSAFSNSSGSASSSVFGIPNIGGGFLAGSGRATASSAAGAESTSQRTLTVVIKFDDDGLVRDYGYHTSRF